MDADYSGKSWSKPIIGKIRYSDGSTTYDRWVVVVSGGMAFNNENVNDKKGKAVFVLDAATSDVIWMVGFDNASGAVDGAGTPELEITAATYTNPSGVAGVKHLTKDGAFNFCIPSAVSAVDKDNNGYIDSIYFGNVAGHVFKVDTSNILTSNWKTYSIFRKDLTTNLATGTITGITINTGLPADTYTVSTSSGAFQLGQNVMGLTSKAMGFITEVGRQGSNDLLTIQETSDEIFQTENIVVRPYDPIFISPAIHKDTCQHYWVSFGTGDRLRSRTNPTPGKFVSLMDTVATPSMLTTSNLVHIDLQLDDGWFPGSTDIKVDNKWGWYFNFPNAAEGEKLFDPDPIILPDANLNPHIFFNTYQYIATASTTEECNAPTSGAMRFYEITVDYCKGGNVTGYREEGGISGGGMMEGSEFIIDRGRRPGRRRRSPRARHHPQTPAEAAALYWRTSLLREKKR